MKSKFEINGVVWTKQSVKELIATNDKAVLNALVIIYNNQTYDEKVVGNTVEHNNIGFNGLDGDILSSFAKQYIVRKTLSPKQMVIAKKKMPKYAGQIFKYMQSKNK